MNGKQVDKSVWRSLEPSADNVVAVDLAKISPNPFQPRKVISEEKVTELAQSIKANGLIQPVVVRRSGNGYQLVVGERRYLACRKLGWEKISAAVKALSDNDMATIALIENLQREDLSFVDEANEYVNLMQKLNITQEELARKLGKTQSTVANKIRLLKLSKPVQEQLIKRGLSERHARALLRLDTEDKQLKILSEISQRGLTVSQAEKRIDRIVEGKKEKGQSIRSKPVIKDLRIVLNTIREAVSLIESSGLYPEVDERVEKDYIEVTIRLSKEMLNPIAPSKKK
ncbi:MAG: nucleoid occlusion protein [Bacillota bacterium]